MSVQLAYPSSRYFRRRHGTCSLKHLLDTKALPWHHHVTQLTSLTCALTPHSTAASTRSWKCSRLSPPSRITHALHTQRLFLSVPTAAAQLTLHFQQHGPDRHCTPFLLLHPTVQHRSRRHSWRHQHRQSGGLTPLLRVQELSRELRLPSAASVCSLLMRHEVHTPLWRALPPGARDVALSCCTEAHNQPLPTRSHKPLLAPPLCCRTRELYMTRPSLACSTGTALLQWQENAGSLLCCSC